MIEIKDGEIVERQRQPQGAGDPLNAQPVRRSSNGGSHRALFCRAGESLRMAMRALKANIFRTVLTLLGIVIGVGSVVAMLAIGEGAKQRVVQDDRLDGHQPAGGAAAVPQCPRIYGADRDADPRRCRGDGTPCPYVMAAMPDVRGNATVRYSNIDYQPDGITATTDALPVTRSWPIARGVFFDEEDINSYATVAVLGNTVYEACSPTAAIRSASTS